MAMGGSTGLLLLMLFVGAATGLDIRSCNSALGMESGDIPDSAINASSSYVMNVLGPRYGRLRKEIAGGGWCPKRPIESGVREWLQVDLAAPHLVTFVETQGRFDHGRGQEYPEEYTLEYWRPGFRDWKPYKYWDGREVLSGNFDTHSVVSRELIPPIFASQIRILPHSVHRRTVCLRLELKGCRDRGGVVSYTIPESPVPELGDTSYDGERQQGILTGGLGRLTDGETGNDNYKQNINPEKGTGWVAWMRDSFPGNYMEMIFHFDHVRTFNAVHIFTNNYFTKDVQVFAQADVWFLGVMDDSAYQQQEENEEFNKPVTYSYIPDTNLENARNVSIALHGRQGSLVKFRLYFAARWIIISEVTFDTWDPYENMSSSSTSGSSAPTEDSTSWTSGAGNEEQASATPAAAVNHDVADLNLQTITARDEGQEYVEVLIGILTAITLLLLLVFVIILGLSRRQKFQSSPTVLKNPFGFAINMKGFLLNLAPGRMFDSGRDSPDEEDEEGDPVDPDEADVPMDDDDDDDQGVRLPEDSPSLDDSLVIDAFISPLADSQYKSTYAIVANAGGKDEQLLRASKSFERGYENASSTRSCSPSSVTRSHHHHNHYRTLQKVNNASPTTSHQQRVEPEYAHVKRYHTTPHKDKHKIAAPVVRWNIGPSMNRPYKCKEIEPANIPGQCLHTMEKLGSGHIGEATVCAVLGLGESATMPNEPLRLAVARIPSSSSELPVPVDDKESLREVRMLSYLADPNLARVLGVVGNPRDPSRPWTIIEYTELGDLAHYLQYSEPLVGTQQRLNCSLNFISQNCLLYMGSQIASAMRYLESRNLMHKDLAARNCLLGRCYSVKVTDIAMCSDLYKKDYSDIMGRTPAPIRWLPWESILMDRYTCSSTVWSFAVTLWEIMSFAREKPFQQLSNEQVIENAELMCYGEELQVLLPKPMMCPEEVYQLMCSCWKRDEDMRPTFKEINSFLKSITADYRPGA